MSVTLPVAQTCACGPIYTRRMTGGLFRSCPLSLFPGSLSKSIQDKIGPEKVVIHVRLYSDATQLNNMGSKKCWGVWMYIGNVPQELRVSRKKKGAAVLLGYIPEVHTAFHGYVNG